MTIDKLDIRKLLLSNFQDNGENFLNLITEIAWRSLRKLNPKLHDAIKHANHYASGAVNIIDW